MEDSDIVFQKKKKKKTQKATAKSINSDNKCFQYTITVGLNHRNIEKYQNLNSFINQWKWKETNLKAESKILKKGWNK